MNLLLLCALVGVAAGADLQWTVYTRENTTFPWSTINDFAVDTGGVVWAAGDTGIVKVINNKWSVPLPVFSGKEYEQVLKMVIDKHNIFWCGTTFGIVKYDGNKTVVYSDYRDRFSVHNDIEDLALDSSGNLWIGIGQNPGGNPGALIRFDGISTWTRFDSTNSPLPNDLPVTALATDRDGSVWVGTFIGLVHFNKGRWTMYDTSNSGMPGNFVASLAIDARGTKWVGLYGNGACSFDGTTWKVFDVMDSRNQLKATVASFAFDNKNTVWFGTYGDGLIKYDGKNQVRLDTAGSVLPDNWVTALSYDAGGNLLVGTWTGGLTVFNGSTWKSYNDACTDCLPSNRVTAVAFEKHGAVWAVTDAGIRRFYNGEWRAAAPLSFLDRSWVYDLDVDKNDVVRIGCESGLARYDGKQCVVTKLNDEGVARYNTVHFVESDTLGHVWAASVQPAYYSMILPGGGLSCYSGVSWKTYTTDSTAIPGDYISALHVCEGGTVWAGIGTKSPASIKCVMFDGNKWSVYDMDSAASRGVSTVNDIAVDPKGEVWVAMSPAAGGGSSVLPGGGLAHLSQANWTIFDTANSGLPSNTVFSVAVDSQGVVWTGGSKGLTYLEGKVWTTFSSYSSPLPGETVNGIAVDPEGKIWVATGPDQRNLPESKQGGIAVVVKPGASGVSGARVMAEKRPVVRSWIGAGGALSIAYTLETASRVRCELFDPLGRTVARLADRTEQAGRHVIAYRLSGPSGGLCHRGIYLWRLTLGDRCFFGKVVK